MTIDERLEAVTQSLELLALRQADGEERHDREMADIRRLATKSARQPVAYLSPA